MQGLLAFDAAFAAARAARLAAALVAVHVSHRAVGPSLRCFPLNVPPQQPSVAHCIVVAPCAPCKRINGRILKPGRLRPEKTVRGKAPPR